MSKTADILFEYLRDVLYHPENATLDLQTLDPEYRMLGEGMQYFSHCLREERDLAKALAKGNLSVKLPPPDNELAAPLKALHASLKHMTWQSQQVAKGDYKQKIDFMGEFSEAFNTMTRQLDQRQKALEAEIENSRQKTLALKRNNSLLVTITNEMQQWIIVLDAQTRKMLFVNKAAKQLSRAHPDLHRAIREKIILAEGEHQFQTQSGSIDISCEVEGRMVYLVVDAHPISWSGHNAIAYIFTDISAEKQQVEHLETVAYKDSLTKMHNRFYGMKVMKEWLEEKRVFSICFSDLDHLKFVNDTYGHNAGDEYLIFTAKLLEEYAQNWGPDALACRLGGDEFMLLMPGASYEQAEEYMAELRTHLLESKPSKTKPYTRSLSYGIVEVSAKNTRSAGDLMAIADKRMYIFKRIHKASRGENQPDNQLDMLKM